VVAEALATSFTLATVTGEQSYAHWHEKLWAHADTFFIDHERGSWRHELDPQNRPSATVWQGKPDIYHAYQATLLPTLGEITSFAEAVKQRSSSAAVPSGQNRELSGRRRRRRRTRRRAARRGAG
jgi:hypothetical protein